jgi:tetratricopeptide (TPR) repeat protein
MLLAGAVMAAGGDAQRAREFYGRAEYQAAIDTMLPLESKTPDSLALLGQAYYGNGEYKQATIYLEKAIAASPSNALYYDWLGKAYGRRAETSSVLTAPFYASKTPRPLGGGMDKAEAIAVRIGRLDAAEFECKLAALAEKRKQFDAAEQHLRRAVAMKPDQVGRMIDLGEFLARRGRYDECEDLLRAAGNRNPGSPSLMFAQASLEIRRGRNLAEAQRLLRSYLASPITPDDPPRLEALRLFKMVP